MVAVAAERSPEEPIFSEHLHLLPPCFCRMGAKWQRIRRILNPRMLKPKHVSSYANTINEVVTDFIERAVWLRAKDGGGVMVNDVAGELYKFAFEGRHTGTFSCFREFFFNLFKFTVVF